jgi:hypothetical protein
MPAVGAFTCLLLMPATSVCAAPSGPRLSVPALGWVLSPDGSQLLEIAGLPESPRPGRSLPLPRPARAVWSAPDASAAILRLDDGFHLVRPDLPEPIVLLPVAEPEQPAPFTAAWDRASLAFAICYGPHCHEFDREGHPLASIPATPGSHLFAYSRQSGLALRTGDGSLLWLREGSALPLNGTVSAAAFRPGHAELWVLDPAGQLATFDSAGSRSPIAELIPDALGLAPSADGATFFAAAGNSLAQVQVETRSVSIHSLEDSVTGLWPAPGGLTVRLHDSPKRPISFWNGGSGVYASAPALFASAPEVQ